MRTTTVERQPVELCDVCRRQTTVQENRWCVECRTVPAETDTIERRIATQRVEDLARLADQGERHGVRVLVDHRSGRHVATSASDPSRCYHVDVERGCSCKGWAIWNRCQHHSLLLAQIGLIEDPEGDPEPEPEPMVTLMIAPPVCAPCRGRGWVYAGDDDSPPSKVACGRCGGQPALAAGLDRWRHVLVEEPAGDVDDDGRFSLDGDAA